MEWIGIVGAASVTLIGTIYVARNSRKSADLAAKIEKNKAAAISKAEIVKTEVLAKADVIKAETKAETQRIDQLIDSQQGFIKLLQEENKQQRNEMLAKDKLHREEMLQIREEVGEISRLMSVCVEERSKFKYEHEKQKALYDALEAQLHSHNEYINKELRGKIPIKKLKKDITIKGEVKGEVQ